MSSNRPRGAAESFEWPPSPTDLSTVSVVTLRRASPGPAMPEAAVLAVAAPADLPQPSRLARVPAVRRRARLATHQQLTLLAAGMLVGAALPGLDDGRRPIIGVTRVAEASSIRTAPVATPVAATATPRTSLPVASSTPSRSPSTSTPASTPQIGSSPAAHEAGNGMPLARSSPLPTSSTARTVDPRTQQVMRLLRSYQTAYSRMDASAAAKVWPSANQAALTKTFTAVREQRLWLHGCTISGAGAQAAGTCRGTLRYRPRVGDHSTRLRYGTWRFALERQAGRWLIRRVTVS